MYEGYQTYKAPMPSFLDKYMEKNRNLGADKILELGEHFEKTTSLLLGACGESLFKTGGTFLLAKFDAVTVGFAKALDSGVELESSEIKAKVEQLLTDQTYISSTSEFINDTVNVIDRVNTAISIFEG